MTGQASALGIVAGDVCNSFDSHLVLDKVNLTADVGSGNPCPRGRRGEL